MLICFHMKHMKNIKTHLVTNLHMSFYWDPEKENYVKKPNVK